MKATDIFQTTLALVEVAEMAVPISEKGKEKLDFVKESAQVIYQTQEDVRKNYKDPQSYVNAVVAIVPLIVRLKNLVGLFKKDAK